MLNVVACSIRQYFSSQKVILDITEPDAKMEFYTQLT